MGRGCADNRSKAATKGGTKTVKVNAFNPRKNLMSTRAPCQRKNGHLDEVEESDSSVDSDGETGDVAEFDNDENVNPNHQEGVTKQLLTNEEWELLKKIRNNELAKDFISNNTPVSSSGIQNGGGFTSTSTLSSRNSSSSNDSCRFRYVGGAENERSRLHFPMQRERQRLDMTSKVDFTNALNGCMPYFLLNKDSDKLMLTDLGVNRDIMTVIDGKPHFAGIHLRGTIKPWYVKIDGKEYPVHEELEALSKVCFSFQAIDMESPINPERLNICSRKKIVVPPNAMGEPPRISCSSGGGESVEIVETFLLSPKLFEIMLRSRGSEYGVATKGEGGQSIRKYLFKLPSNNLGGMTKKLKSTSLLEFLSKDMQDKFLEGVAGIRRALIDAGNPDIRPKPFISNLRAMQIVGEESSSNVDGCKYQTILEALLVKLRMWKYEHEYNEIYPGAEYLTLTSATNEAFVLGCLFEIAAGRRNFCNTGAFKAANMVRDLVKESRKDCANDVDRDYFKDQRKKLFRDWGIFGKKCRKSRDTSGKFSRFNGTGNSDDEEQNQMLSLDALEEE